MHLRIKLSSADAQMGVGFADEIRIGLTWIVSCGVGFPLGAGLSPGFQLLF